MVETDNVIVDGVERENKLRCRTNPPGNDTVNCPGSEYCGYGCIRLKQKRETQHNA